MTRHLVLLLSSDTQRREAWSRSTRGAGRHALQAPTLERALFLMSKVCPSLVLTEGELEDERVLQLLRAVRTIEPLRRVIIVVLGEVTDAEQEHIASDPRSHLRPVDTRVEQIVDEFLNVAYPFCHGDAVSPLRRGLSRQF